MVARESAVAFAVVTELEMTADTASFCNSAQKGTTNKKEDGMITKSGPVKALCEVQQQVHCEVQQHVHCEVQQQVQWYSSTCSASAGAVVQQQVQRECRCTVRYRCQLQPVASCCLTGRISKSYKLVQFNMEFACLHSLLSNYIELC